MCEGKVTSSPGCRADLCELWASAWTWDIIIIMTLIHSKEVFGDHSASELRRCSLFVFWLLSLRCALTWQRLWKWSTTEWCGHISYFDLVSSLAPGSPDSNIHKGLKIRFCEKRGRNELKFQKQHLLLCQSKIITPTKPNCSRS